MKTKSLLQGILDASPDAITVYESVQDTDGAIVDMRLVMLNKLSAQLTRISPDLAIGQLLSRLPPTVYERERFQWLKKIAQTGESFDQEVKVPRGDGTSVWLKASIRRFDQYVILTYTDISRRKQDEVSRESQTAVLESIFSTSLIGIIVYEAIRDEANVITDFRFVRINQTGLTMLNYPASVIGQTLKQVYPAAVTDGLFNQFTDICENNTPFDVEYYGNERARWYAIMGVQLGDGLMVTYQDITVRKRAEEARQQQTDLLIRISEAAHIGITIHEPVRDERGQIIDFRYAYFNEQAKSWLPKDWRQVINQTIRSTNFANNADAMIAPMTRVIETGEPFQIDIPLADGRIIFSIVSRFGEGTVSTFLDVTQQRKAEQQARYSAELEEKVADRTRALMVTLEKLEESKNDLVRALATERELSELKVRFVAMASHEFRTPLTAVMTSASLIERYTRDDQQDKREKHIHRIRTAVKHLNAILEEFLSIDKLEEGQIQVNPAQVNIYQLINEAISYMQDALKPNQTIQTHLACPHSISVDASLLSKILINLLSNAIKYSGPGSTVTVHGTYTAGQLTISIQDQGIGMSEEDQKHMFERFFRAHNVMNIEGTGLGLHIVSRYVKLMGGQIDLSSELNEGTTVTFTLPA